MANSKLRTILNLLLLFCVFCAFRGELRAQNFTAVTASKVQDLTGAPLASGQVCFLGVNNSNVPISYQAGGGGQVIAAPACATVTTGAFSLTVANTALTTPANVCYRVTVTDSSGNVLIGAGGPFNQSGYQCVQPTGSSFNFDGFSPLLPANAVATTPTQPTITDTGSSYVTVSASKIQDATGTALASGQICFTATTNAGAPISFLAAGGGQAIGQAVCTTITSGAFSITLANSAQTVPRNICYKTRVTDGSGNVLIGAALPGQSSGYDCVQTAGSNNWCSASACNFDLYPPTLAALATSNAVAGPQGPAGAAATVTVGTTTTGAAGTNAGVSNSGTSSAAVLNFTIPQGATGAQGSPGPAGPTVYPGAGLAVSTGSAWGTSLATAAFLGDPGANGIVKRTAVGATSAAVPGTDYVMPGGNVATATALAATPSQCGSGYAPTGIASNGNAQGCQAVGGGGGAPGTYWIEPFTINPQLDSTGSYLMGVETSFWPPPNSAVTVVGPGTPDATWGKHWEIQAGMSVDPNVGGVNEFPDLTSTVQTLMMRFALKGGISTYVAFGLEDALTANNNAQDYYQSPAVTGTAYAGLYAYCATTPCYWACLACSVYGTTCTQSPAVPSSSNSVAVSLNGHHTLTMPVSTASVSCYLDGTQIGGTITTNLPAATVSHGLSPTWGNSQSGIGGSYIELGPASFGPLP